MDINEFRINDIVQISVHNQMHGIARVINREEDKIEIEWIKRVFEHNYMNNNMATCEITKKDIEDSSFSGIDEFDLVERKMYAGIRILYGIVKLDSSEFNFSNELSCKVDVRGRIVLPKEIRERIGIAENDTLEISCDKKAGVVILHLCDKIFDELDDCIEMQEYIDDDLPF